MAGAAKIHIATVLGPHGVRGQVCVRSLTASPPDLFSYAPLTDETGKRVFKLTKRGEKKDCFIVEVDGVSSRNEAEAIKGLPLYVAREVLPELDGGVYYLADIVGLAARDEAGKTVGVVEAFHDYGAGVFLEIKPSGGKSFMLPFKEPFVAKVRIETGSLDVKIPEGWLKEEGKE